MDASTDGNSPQCLHCGERSKEEVHGGCCGLLYLYDGDGAAPFSISTGYSHLSVDTQLMRICQIVTLGVRYFLSSVLQKDINDLSIKLRGGAVLAILKTATRTLDSFPLHINDIDYQFDCDAREMSMITYGINLLKRCNKDSTVMISISPHEMMRFKIIDVVNFDEPAGTGLVKLETIVDGTTWKIDISNSFGKDQIDYYANTISIIYNDLHPQGLLSLNKQQLKSLVYLIMKKPQPCILFEKNSYFSRDPISLEKLVLAFSRIIKGTSKGFITQSISYFKPGSEKCPICMTDHDYPPLRTAKKSDGSSILRSESDSDLHKIFIDMKCGHHICAMCFYIMRRQYSNIDSYDIRCPLCREDITLNGDESWSKRNWDTIPSVNKFMKEFMPEWCQTTPQFSEKITTQFPWNQEETQTKPTLIQKIKLAIEQEYNDDADSSGNRISVSGYGLVRIHRAPAWQQMSNSG